ncbi:uncharacterized protein CXorf65 homolog [Amia ocellicauda]|uniref:uncharacterized protein CXorf65 homolog n=1 Tax=Amia ocellicauda TaxID=2972642 RepID=UPI003464A670
MLIDISGLCRICGEMFITVLHGDNEQTLFNIQCKTVLLLDSIKLKCHCKNEAEIDLADDSGQVKNLLPNQQRCASELLSERGEYVLVSISRPPGSQQPVYTPILQDEDFLGSKFLANLSSKEPRVGLSRTRTKKLSQKMTSSASITSTESKESSSPQRVKPAGQSSSRTKQGRKD